MKENKYDSRDIIRRESVLQAEGFKIASYRVRDPETNEFGDLQYHITHNNTVIAIMSETMLRLLIQFAGLDKKEC